MMNKITLHLTEEESRIYGYGLVLYRKMIHPSGEFLLDPPEQWTLRGQLIEQYEAKICWETLDSLLTDDSYRFDGTDLVIDPIVALFMLLKLFDAYYTMAFTYDVKQVQKETRADLKKNYDKLNVEFEPSWEATGPFGAKSIGEIVINTPAPAIAHAIFNATGVWHRTLPITAEKIFMEIKEKIENSIK